MAVRAGHSPKSLTPQDNLETVLRVCDEYNVTEYTRYCTVLTGFAESDFRSGAVQVMQDGASVTTGVYQQSSRWWPSALQGTEAQCLAFLAAFRPVTGDMVQDCWFVQQWNAPDPRTDPTAFAASPETKNYADRVPLVAQIINERRLP